MTGIDKIRAAIEEADSLKKVCKGVFCARLAAFRFFGLLFRLSGFSPPVFLIVRPPKRAGEQEGMNERPGQGARREPIRRRVSIQKIRSDTLLL